MTFDFRADVNTKIETFDGGYTSYTLTNDDMIRVVVTMGSREINGHTYRLAPEIRQHVIWDGPYGDPEHITIDSICFMKAYYELARDFIEWLQDTDQWPMHGDPLPEVQAPPPVHEPRKHKSVWP